MSTAGQRARIQLMSLVAIVFVLLAVFAAMALGMEKKSSIRLQIDPGWCNCGRCGQDRHEKAVVLQVADCGIYWNRELITQRELPDRLAKLVSICKTPGVALAADDSARYGTTVVVLDEVRRAGIRNVIVETVYRPTGK